ncbi:MAG: hypothetical protein JW900_06525 [Anaerolineae bacterium]|nr:hypothetical protein [Anaerolineae bacterium]
MSELETRERCRWCGQDHDGMCPHVSRIEYFPDGLVKRVTFRHPGSPERKQQPAEVSTLDLPCLLPSATPEQLQAWGLGRSQAIDFILVLGKAGPMVRGELALRVAAHRGVSSAAGNLARTLKRIREKGLVSVRYIPSARGGFYKGNAWLYLSKTGAEIYRQATGEEPVLGFPDDAPGGPSQE